VVAALHTQKNENGCRMSLLFNKKVNILRATHGRDSIGGYDSNSQIHLENLPCRINWKTGKEVMLGGQRTARIDGVLFCRVVDIKVSDILVIDGTEYDIVSVDDTDCANKLLKVSFKKK